MKTSIIATALLLGLATAVIGDDHEKDPNTLTEKQKKAGWALLFDGESTKGWTGWKKDDVPKAWKVEEGVLSLKGRGGDIRTEKMYADFELVLDFKIAKNGNSGIFYRSTEDRGGPWETGPEFQILDNNSTKYGDAKIETNIAGSNYGLYESDRDASKKPGEWNTAKIVAKGNKIEHWLNGKKVVEYDISGDDFKKRVKNSKFKAWPDFAQKEKGYIVLQDHGDEVSFRNIRIRELKDEDDKEPTANADWPKVIKKELYAKHDLRGKKAPQFAVGQWLTDEPDTSGKVVLIDFWATWCGPCRTLIPELNEFHETFGNDLVVIGVSDETKDKVSKFMAHTDVAYPMAIDPKGKMKKAVGVQGIPHVLIVDSRGIVRWQGFPGSQEDKLTADIIRQVITTDKTTRNTAN